MPWGEPTYNALKTGAIDGMMLNVDRGYDLKAQRAANTAYQSLGAVMDRSFNTQIADLREAGATVRILKPQEIAQWQATTRYQRQHTLK